MKIIFFGTPDYVLPIVETLHKNYNTGREKQFIAVVTQGPKPIDRDKHIEHSAVDNWAYKHKIQIITNLNKQKLPEADLGILAAYGEIIEDQIIEHFRFGILNVHPSILPKFRGASPIQAAIAMNTNPTGLTIMKLVTKLDAGPIISYFKEDILPDDTTGSLRIRMFVRSGQFLIDLIPNYISGKITPKPQDETKVSFCRSLKKEDGFIEPKYLEPTLKGTTLKGQLEIKFIKDYFLVPNAFNLDCFIRAMNPWPIAWTHVRIEPSGEIKKLKIIRGHLEEEKLVLDEVQLESKNPVSWKEFQRGYPKYSF